MGGGGGDHGHHGDAAHGGDFRNKVWSMTGGPYCRPKHWKRNTAIAMAGIFLICIPIAMKSAQLEATTTSTSSPHTLAALVQELWFCGCIALIICFQEQYEIVIICAPVLDIRVSVQYLFIYFKPCDRMLRS
ncbi:unnamed protein product [Camellia sinensis]